MMNHHSGPGTAEEIHRILPVLAGLSADEVTTEQDRHTTAGQKVDAAELDFPYEESAVQKIFLPWRSNDPRFAPQQYYYAASKSGVVPSWAISAAVHLD